MGVAELEQVRQQFAKVAEQTQALTAGLSEPQFNWRPAPDQWSMEECFGHLVIVGQYEIKLVEAAVEQARAQGIRGNPPFRYGFLEQMILRQTEPTAPRKFRSPKRFRPVHGQPLTAIIPTFLHLQSQF